MNIISRLKGLLKEKPDVAAQIVEKSRKDRAPRVNVNSLHNLRFTTADSNNQAPFAIVNISTTGIGLKISSTDFQQPNKDKIEGQLSIGENHYAASLRIVRRGEEFLGAIFEDATAELSRSIKLYFDTEIAAINLNAVRPDLLKQEPDGIPHWYHGDNNCGLTFVSLEEEVLRFTLTVFGNFIEGGKDLPLHAGSVVKDDSKGKASYKASEILQRERNFDKSIFETGERLVMAIEMIEPAHRKALLAYLNQYKSTVSK